MNVEQFYRLSQLVGEEIRKQNSMPLLLLLPSFTYPLIKTMMMMIIIIIIIIIIIYYKHITLSLI
jgi:hypothetical protein